MLQYSNLFSSTLFHTTLLFASLYYILLYFTLLYITFSYRTCTASRTGTKTITKTLIRTRPRTRRSSLQLLLYYVSVCLQQARPVVAQRNRSGRARALAWAACRFRSPTLAQNFVSAPEARNYLSHLYKGMRLPPLSEHIEFPTPQQRFCENVLLARPLLQSAATQISKSQESTESTETLQNTHCWTLLPQKAYICKVLELI